MRRSPELSPLSRDHHVALAHALRLRRATREDVAGVAAGFLDFFAGDGSAHFAAEEELLLPHVPPAREVLAQRLLDEHEAIRAASRALGREPSVDGAHRLGERLAAHVRFEERELFPLLEATLPAARLEAIGRRLDR